MNVIVLTGGPCGGKTTAIEAIQKEFESGKVLVAPEPATMLMSTGFPAPGRDLTYSEMWQLLFQNAVTALQVNMEESFKIVANQTRAQLIVCDRGLLDGAAYFSGGLPAFLREYHLNASDAFARYDRVVHLESTATCCPAIYGKAGNSNRYESLDEAAALELRTRDAWRGHPNWTFISGKDGIDSVVARVLSIVSEYVDVEIERKWWLPEFPVLPGTPKVLPIKQGYLVAEKDELRVRLIGDETYIAAKGEGTIRRDEWERPLPRKMFEKLWAQTGTARIEKLRHFIPFGEFVLELDVYQGELDGLITLECEFRDREEADDFILPDWADEAIEVTNDPEFKNKNLALYGLPSLVM